METPDGPGGRECAPTSWQQGFNRIYFRVDSNPRGATLGLPGKFPVLFGAVMLFRPGVFVVREFSYHAARITRCENPVRNIARDHTARTDNRP